jgi:hypothetical protein
MSYDVRTYEPGQGYPEPASAPAAVAPAAAAVPAPVVAPADPVAPAGAGAAPVAPVEVAAPVANLEPYKLAVPQDVPPEFHGDAETVAVLDGFSAAAVGAGLSQPIAEMLLGSYVDAQHIFRYGATASEDYSAEDGARVLQGFWGDKYQENIDAVRRTVKSLGSRFADWLDQGMGNSPATCVALLHLSDLKLDKKAASAELAKVMATKEWASGQKSAVLRAKALGRIAYAD